MDEKQRPDTELGVSSFLPPLAAAVLVRAAGYAKLLPEGSVERILTINRAIKSVKAEWPSYFLPTDGGCERQRKTDRAGSSERSLFG